MQPVASILARSAIPAATAREPAPMAATGDRAKKTVGAISIDMDALADYAGGYGFEHRPVPDPVYTIGLARFLDLLKKRNIKATLFVIARDTAVPAHADILRRAVGEGHEIANHTLNHPRRLSALSDDGLRREIIEAHDTLSALAGRAITGFRAPCYDICRRSMDMLRRLEYRYDSSIHPSMIAPVIDAAVLLKSHFRKWEARPGSYAQLLAPLRPFVPHASNCWRKARRKSSDLSGNALVELPLSAMPISRAPFYGTWMQMTGMPLFRKSLAWLRRFDIPLNYHFHAVELVALTDADVDSRFRVHPGMSRPIVEKIRDIDEMLFSFSNNYNLMTLDSMAMEYTKS